jgi:hypothetical protein
MVVERCTDSCTASRRTGFAYMGCNMPWEADSPARLAVRRPGVVQVPPVVAVAAAVVAAVAVAAAVLLLLLLLLLEPRQTFHIIVQPTACTKPASLLLAI